MKPLGNPVTFLERNFNLNVEELNPIELKKQKKRIYHIFELNSDNSIATKQELDALFIELESERLPMYIEINKIKDVNEFYNNPTIESLLLLSDESIIKYDKLLNHPIKTTINQVIKNAYFEKGYVKEILINYIAEFSSRKIVSDKIEREFLHFIIEDIDNAINEIQLLINKTTNIEESNNSIIKYSNLINNLNLKLIIELKNFMKIECNSLSISINNFGNKFLEFNDSYSQVVPMLDLAKRLAISEEDIYKIENNIKIINKLIEDNNCYFCKKNKPEKEFAYTRLMYKETFRTTFPRRVGFNKLDVKIARCKKCHEIHNRYNNSMATTIIIILVLSAGIAWVTKDFNIAIIGIAISFIVYYIKKDSFRNNGILNTTKEDLMNHKDVLYLSREGWVFDEPSA